MKKFSFFIPYLKQKRTAITIAVLLLLADVWLATSLPWYMSEIVDHGVLVGDLEAVYNIGLRMTMIALGDCAVAYCSSVVMAVMAQRISNSMRKDLFRKIHSLSYGQTDDMTPGLLVTRVMSDTQIVTQFGTALLQMLLKPLALLLFGLAMLVRISLCFIWVFAVAIPVQVLLLALFIRRLNPLFTKIQLQIERLNARIQETLSNLRLIKAFTHQDYEDRKFRRLNTDLLDLNLDIQYTLAVMNPLIMLVINLVLIGIVAMGGSLVRSGEVEVGRVIAAIMYIQQIMMSLMMIGQIFQVAAKAAVSCGRLQEISDMQPALKDGSMVLDEAVRSLSLEEVSFRYTGASLDSPPALDSISFSLTSGSFTAIVGPTGSGKSTLAALVARFYAASSGRVLLNNREIGEWTESSLRGKVAVVLQKSAICSGSIADNIRYGMDTASADEVRRAAEIAQAAGFIDQYADGYETPVSQQGASLSGGQKQSIAIARALLRRPDVLILDDSTSSMDMTTERRFREALRAACPDLILVVIAQRILSVSSADRILVLENGRITGSGTHEELMLKHPLYRGMVRSQEVCEALP